LWQPHWRAPTVGILGPCPASYQAYTANGLHQQQKPYTGMVVPPQQQQLDLALLTALQNMQLPGNQEWFMDSYASSHMASDHGILSSLCPSSSHKIIVGNGASLHVTHISSYTLSFHPKHIYLQNILVIPHIIKNLISICQFTIDNLCSIEGSSHQYRDSSIK
jgi:hypothetical protein